MGLLDLGSPLFTLLHACLSGWMPPLIEIGLWALLCAWGSMWLYRRLSRQQALLEIKGEIRVATHELAAYDGDFAGMLSKVKQALGLTLRQLRLTLLPALLASFPALLVMTWLSNTFEYALPQAGDIQIVSVTPLEESLTWSPALASQEKGKWQVVWPDFAHPITVRDRNGLVLASIPSAMPVPVLHKRLAWNWLIGNPAGYLPEHATVDALEISLPAMEIVKLGPPWMRMWMTPFLLVLVSWSIWLKMKWRLL